MPLITPSGLITVTDQWASAWELLASLVSTEAPGTIRHGAVQGLAYVVSDADDADVELDLIPSFRLARAAVEPKAVIRTLFGGAISALANHIQNQGATGEQSSLVAYLAHQFSLTPFTYLVAPAFADLYSAYQVNELYSAGIYNTPPLVTIPAVMSPGISPHTGHANGMGKRAVGGAFAAGQAVDTSRYVEVRPLLVVTTTFEGGDSLPTFSVTGTDNLGATTTSWTGTAASNNPASTITAYLDEDVERYTKVAFVLLDAPDGDPVTEGVEIGSELTVDAGTVAEEVVVVEAKEPFRALFRNAHSAGAEITLKRSIVLTPSVAGRRLRSVSGITIPSGYSAGQLMVVGTLDRAPI